MVSPLVRALLLAPILFAWNTSVFAIECDAIESQANISAYQFFLSNPQELPSYDSATLLLSEGVEEDERSKRSPVFPLQIVETLGTLVGFSVGYRSDSTHLSFYALDIRHGRAPPA